MSNETVRQVFMNYLLIRDQGFDAFTREQSKLLSPNLVTLVSDSRGSFTYEGIDGFFEGMVTWSKHFFVNGQSRQEYVEETSTHVLVRMHGDLKLSEPINGESISKEGDHDWTEEFELANDLITKVDIKLFFNQPCLIDRFSFVSSFSASQRRGWANT
jgi:hypothetical protein